MPTFEYKATDGKGNLIVDTLVAGSKKDAEELIKDKDLNLLSVENKEKKGEINLPFFKDKFPLKEKVAFCRYLSVMLSAGLPVEEAFDLLVKGTENKLVKKVLQDVSFSLRQGQSILSGFSRYSQHFDKIFLAMVKTGEVSGTLEKSFSYLSDQYKKQDSLKKKVINALLYPAIIVCLMFAIGFLMLTFVLPRLGKVFLRLNVDLPLTTRLMLQLSLFLEKNLLWVVLSLLLLSILMVLFAMSKKGSDFFNWVGLKVPVAKQIILHYNLARFNQSLSATLSGGVAVGESLEIACQSLLLPGKDQLAKEFNEKISKGISLEDAFVKAKIFPPLMTRLIAVGEKTGTLGETLSDAASFYQEEVENSLNNLVTLLEPILMVLVGLGVAVMIISFISPIYSLITQLSAT